MEAGLATKGARSADAAPRNVTRCRHKLAITTVGKDDTLTHTCVRLPHGGFKPE